MVKTRKVPLALSRSAPTFASVGLLELTGIETVEEGWLVSFTVNVAVEPDSLTEPLADETIKPADSSSVVDIATS